MDIFTLILQILDHGRHLYLLASSLIAYIQHLKFSLHKPFIYLGRFISYVLRILLVRYCCLHFFHSIYRNVLYIYYKYSIHIPCIIYSIKKAFGHYVLILCPATVLNVFIGCKSFLMESLRSFISIIISPINKDILAFFFPMCSRFIPFTYLIVVTKTSSTYAEQVQGEWTALSLS